MFLRFCKRPSKKHDSAILRALASFLLGKRHHTNLLSSLVNKKLTKSTFVNAVQNICRFRENEHKVGVLRAFLSFAEQAHASRALGAPRSMSAATILPFATCRHGRFRCRRRDSRDGFERLARASARNRLGDKFSFLNVLRRMKT